MAKDKVEKAVEDKGKSITIDYRQVGQTGLKRFSGFIFEEYLKELTGWQGAAIYEEMSNDPVISGVLFIIDKLIRRVPWTVKAASTLQSDQEAAEFIEQCMDDMEYTWVDTIVEILSFIKFGYSVHEINYKQRCGESLIPHKRSKYSDGRIGWRSFPIRSQDTVYRWIFDEHGNIEGIDQIAPPTYRTVRIPIEKMLHFRTTIHKNNPEGRSLLRGAYSAWYRKKNIENIEAIGVERDLAGLPMAWVPSEWMMEGASEGQKALVDRIKNIVTNVRRDEQEGMVLPMIYDSNGKQMFDFKLLTTGGTRQLDTDKIVSRYDQRIALSMCADFMLLGSQNAQGSWAMHSDKTKLFAMAIGAFLDIIAQQFNRFAIPRLMAVNDFAITDMPQLQHGDVNSRDLVELGDYITKLAGAGMPIFPNPKLEQYLLKVANLPESDEETAEPDARVEGLYTEPITTVKEITEDLKETPPTVDGQLLYKADANTGKI